MSTSQDVFYFLLEYILFPKINGVRVCFVVDLDVLYCSSVVSKRAYKICKPIIDEFKCPGFAVNRCANVRKRWKGTIDYHYYCTTCYPCGYLTDSYHPKYGYCVACGLWDEMYRGKICGPCHRKHRLGQLRDIKLDYRQYKWKWYSNKRNLEIYELTFEELRKMGKILIVYDSGFERDEINLARILENLLKDNNVVVASGFPRLHNPINKHIPSEYQYAETTQELIDMCKDQKARMVVDVDNKSNRLCYSGDKYIFLDRLDGHTVGNRIVSTSHWDLVEQTDCIIYLTDLRWVYNIFEEFIPLESYEDFKNCELAVRRPLVFIKDKIYYVDV